MRILSIIIHGGTTSCCVNKLKHCLLILILPFFLYSCDLAYNLKFEGQTYPFVYLKVNTNTVRIKCIYFQGVYYLIYGLEGSYIVNYDSLKLQTNDENLVISTSCKDVRTYRIHKEDCLSIRLVFDRKTSSVGIADSLVLSILPSDFITFNGQRITNDTLRVELKSGSKKYKHNKQ